MQQKEKERERRIDLRRSAFNNDSRPRSVSRARTAKPRASLRLSCFAKGDFSIYRARFGPSIACLGSTGTCDGKKRKKVGDSVRQVVKSEFNQSERVILDNLASVSLGKSFA